MNNGNANDRVVLHLFPKILGLAYTFLMMIVYGDLLVAGWMYAELDQCLLSFTRQSKVSKSIVLRATIYFVFGYYKKVVLCF